MLCKFCTKPFNRIGRGIYCSSVCNKRSWYLRNSNAKQSFFAGNPQKGIAWEEWFIKKFGATRPSKSLNTPFDFFWNGEKIDLKVCELYKRKNKRGKAVKGEQAGCWIFNRNGDDADFILCVGLENSRPIRYWKIPDKIFPRSGATIGRFSSKYDPFIVQL